MKQSYPVLCLNADYRPMSTHPFLVEKWQRAVKQVFLDRVTVLEEYPKVLHCPGSNTRKAFEMNIPSVIALKKYQPQHKPAAFTRIGVYLRARGSCAYCGTSLTLGSLTFDHVIPQSKGGKTTWLNCVSACSPCNSRKSNKSLKDSGLRLLEEHKPFIPSRAQITEIGLDWIKRDRTVHDRVHQTWLPYIGLDNFEIDPKQDVLKAVKPKDEALTNAVFPEGMTASQYWNVELESE